MPIYLPPGSGAGGGGAAAEPTAWETLGADTATSRGTSVTSGGAHTKGSWTQLDASTAEDTNLLVVAIRMASSGAHSVLVDIGVGAAAAETVVIPNLHVAGSGQDVNYFAIPVAIPAGSRISARSACSTATQACFVTAFSQKAGPLAAPPSTVATYGADTAATRGTNLDPDVVVNTKGSWVQLTASSSADINALVVNVGGQRNTARANATWLIDVAKGGSGSEVVVLSNLVVGQTGGLENIAPMSLPPMVVPTIPAGTRLSVRAQANTTDPTDRTLDILLHAS